MSSSFRSKTVRTTLQDFLVSLPITYFVHFIVLVYALISLIKVCACAVIPFCLMSTLLTFQCGECGHLSVSFKKSSVNLNNAGSAKWLDRSNVPEQEVEYIFYAFDVYHGAEFSSGYGDNTTIKGRMKASSEFWASSLATSDFVLSVINEGHRLPFSQFPSLWFLRNDMSACRHTFYWREDRQFSVGDRCLGCLPCV